MSRKYLSWRFWVREEKGKKMKGRRKEEKDRKTLFAFSCLIFSKNVVEITGILL